MQLKFIVAIVAMAAVPVCAQAQNAPKPTKAAAQRVVQIVSTDKAKTKTYCDLASLGEQMDQAEQNKDSKKAEGFPRKRTTWQPRWAPNMPH